MSNMVLAQYRCIWDKEDFKRTSEKNKKNRNLECGGMELSLHSASSIPMNEHRRRLKEKFGEEPSHAVLFQATYKRKKIDKFVCKRAQQVMVRLQKSSTSHCVKYIFPAVLPRFGLICIPLAINVHIIVT